MARVRSNAILKFARGQRCTARIACVCNYDPATTVAAHGPDKHRGQRQKTSDYWVAYLCSSCHAHLDERKQKNWHEVWLEAIRETQELLVETGLLSFPETVKQRRKTQKIMTQPTRLQRMIGETNG